MSDYCPSCEAVRKGLAKEAARRLAEESLPPVARSIDDIERDIYFARQLHAENGYLDDDGSPEIERLLAEREQLGATTTASAPCPDPHVEAVRNRLSDRATV